MNEKHHDNLKMYLNDMIGLERDILNAVDGQLEDERVASIPHLQQLLQTMVTGSKARLERLRELSEAEGGKLGATVKEAATSVTGALAGLYGKLREHPVSRMVRDDVVALNVASVSYTMLYTLGRGIGHSACASVARDGMAAVPPLIMDLTRILPGIVLGELADDAPLSDPAAENVVLGAIHDVWAQDTVVKREAAAVRS